MAKGIFKKFFKGAMVTLLTITTALTAFAGCSCGKNPNKPTPPATQKVTVESVIEDELGSFSFNDEYVMTINGVAINSIDDFKKVNEVVVEAGQNCSKLTITAETNAGEEVSYTAENIQGDVADWQERGLKTDKENVNMISSELRYEKDATIVDDSTAELEIRAYVREVVDEFNATGDYVESATYTIIEDPTIDPTPTPDPEPPVEIVYVTAGDVVSYVLGDIDVEADIQEVAQAIATTKAPTMSLNEVLAVDLDENADKLLVYVKGTSSGGTVSIIEFEVPYTNSDFYDYIENAKEKINSVLTAKGLNENSQIEENSTAHNDLIFALEGLETSYETEKTALSSTAKSNIAIDQLFNLTELSAEKMTELGITDMNDFSKALLNNTRGDGYEKVTSFTEDDIIATYVNSASSLDINKRSAFTIVTITKQGIFSSSVYSVVTSSSETYAKILNDSADAVVGTHTILVDYNNPIIYQNGNRVVEEVAAINPNDLGRTR